MRATFRVAKMDCSAEEQLVRMKLDGLAAAVQIDLDQRTVTVSHDGDIAEIKTALDSLNFETTQLDTVAGTAEPESAEANERSVLTIALLINAGFFVVELVAGLVARSMGLVADSLDMLADASVYALSLLAVGGSIQRKKSLAAGSGYLQLGLAALGLVEVARRFLNDEALPDVTTMIVVSALALAGNVATLLVLKRAKSEEAHFQASWIFTANDVKVNGLVIVSAIVVAITDNPAADLLAGAAIFVIVANGARRILSLAR
jgi:Co/Zn/Cd efflux system component